MLLCCYAFILLYASNPFIYRALHLICFYAFGSSGVGEELTCQIVLFNIIIIIGQFEGVLLSVFGKCLFVWLINNTNLTNSLLCSFNCRGFAPCIVVCLVSCVLSMSL